MKKEGPSCLPGANLHWQEPSSSYHWLNIFGTGPLTGSAKPFLDEGPNSSALRRLGVANQNNLPHP